MENGVGYVKAIPTAIGTIAVAMDVSKLRLQRYPLPRACGSTPVAEPVNSKYGSCLDKTL